MKAVRAFAAAACALAALGAAAQDRACGKAEAAAAEKAIDRVVNWPQLHKAWQDYRHCDSGPVDELFTDALLRLAVAWKNVELFADAVQKDAQFKAFVHKHLTSEAAAADRSAVYSRAKQSCPAKLDAFCAELAEVVKPVKSELEQLLQPLPSLTPPPPSPK